MKPEIVKGLMNLLKAETERETLEEESERIKEESHLEERDPADDPIHPTF